MTANFGRVGVFCGGRSEEREISLQTGKAVYAALLAHSVDVTMVDVGRGPIKFDEYDTAFIALHGRDGEDGKFQAILEYYNIPYTGSGVEASSVSMNKWYTKAVWESVGITTPQYWVARNGKHVEHGSVEYPVYVKPVNGGSSIGITYVADESEMDTAMKLAAKYDDFVLIEQAINGEEYTYSYLKNRDDLPLIKLETQTEFYDYEAKYVRDDTKYIVAPKLDNNVSESYKNQAIRAFEILGMSGWGRIDFLVDNNHKAWFIEANGVPGMTSHSLVPMAAHQAGIDFGRLCLHILETAIDEE